MNQKALRHNHHTSFIKGTYTSISEYNDLKTDHLVEAITLLSQLFCENNVYFKNSFPLLALKAL